MVPTCFVILKISKKKIIDLCSEVQKILVEEGIIDNKEIGHKKRAVPRVEYRHLHRINENGSLVLEITSTAFSMQLLNNNHAFI